MKVFVDTNILIDYINQQDVRDILNKSNDEYFYTETVKKEFSKRHNKYDINKKFTFVNSDIKETDLNFILRDIQDYLKLDLLQAKSFYNDFIIIIEAGYGSFKDEIGVLEKIPIEFPILITKNMKFYHKFIKNIKNKELLEDMINDNGLEHLIKVVPYDNYINHVF